MAPAGETLEEFFQNLDEITDLIKEKWNKRESNYYGTQQICSHILVSITALLPPIMRKFMRMRQPKSKRLRHLEKLGGENYVFWGGREGYETLLNTDMKFEQDNIARLFKMAIAYGEKSVINRSSY